MWYWLYKLIVIICTPVIWIVSLIPFIEMNVPRFCTILLFWNKWKSMYVYLQMKMETANFTSRKCQEYNNCFGLGVLRDGTVPRLAKGTVDLMGQRLCIYSSISDNIYSYYDTIYKKIPHIGEFMDKTPPIPYVPSSTEGYKYILATSAVFHYYNWFTADRVTYATAIAEKYKSYSNSYGSFYLVVGLTIWIVYSALRIIGYLFKGKQYIEKKIKGYTSKNKRRSYRKAY